MPVGPENTSVRAIRRMVLDNGFKVMSVLELRSRARPLDKVEISVCNGTGKQLYLFPHHMDFPTSVEDMPELFAPETELVVGEQ